jgi:twitching motility protein PilT
VSQLIPLLAKLKESGAERVFYAPNEHGLAIEGEARRPLPGAPIDGSAILEAVSELLSNEDIQGLSSRPRIVRHEHDGEDFVLEIVRQESGVALGIRQAARPQQRLRDSSRQYDPPPAARPQPAPAAAKPIELELGSRVPVAPPDERLDTKPVKRPNSPPPAAPAAAINPDAIRQIAIEAAREVARQIATETARTAAREIAFEAGTAAAREVSVAAAREALEAAGAATREALEAAGASAREVAVEEARTVVRDALRDARVDAERGSRPGAQPEVARARSGPAKIDVLLREMLQRKASDLHLTAGSYPVLRVDGEIHFGTERGVLSSADILGMVQEIMTPRARGDFETLHDADFAHEIPGLARFRVNVFQDRQGTGAVLRQIPIEVLSAEKLGLPKACLDLCWLSKGLVLVTGPTGSGKSTTLAAMIDFINKNRADHIITIEDPVEFVHQNQKCLVNQREVGQHTKSFKNALRAALREDPDIVLVGEMRDLETISIAIETAETGHLVFGTLHTTTAISTVDRIIDQFPSDRQSQIRVMLSESLKGVVAQVLCPKIGGGRVAAHEILLGNHAVASMIREGKTFQLASTMQTSKAQGMVTMNDSLLALVQKKLVDPKQAYMKAVDKNGFATMLRSAGIAPPV